MHTRKLGREGLEVSALGLGCMGMSDFYAGCDEAEAVATIHRATELGIGYVAYSPLGRGFLTGQIRRIEDLPEDDYRRHSPRFQGENFQKNLDLVREIEAMAREKGCTPAQLALAWLQALNR